MVYSSQITQGKHWGSAMLTIILSVNEEFMPVRRTAFLGKTTLKFFRSFLTSFSDITRLQKVRCGGLHFLRGDVQSHHSSQSLHAHLIFQPSLSSPASLRSDIYGNVNHFSALSQTSRILQEKEGDTPLSSHTSSIFWLRSQFYIRRR